MATRAPTRCTQCKKLATHQGRCDTHQTKPWERKSANTRALTGRQRARFRDSVLRANPTCAWCNQPATEADHILAIALGGDPHDWENNGQGLCSTHHDIKTRRDNDEARARKAHRTY